MARSSTAAGSAVATSHGVILPQVKPSALELPVTGHPGSHEESRITRTRHPWQRVRTAARLWILGTRPLPGVTGLGQVGGELAPGHVLTVRSADRSR